MHGGSWVSDGGTCVPWDDNGARMDGASVQQLVMKGGRR